MNKRRLSILLLAIVAMTAVLVVVFHREREPEYGGKKLSEWVERAVDPRLATAELPFSKIAEESDEAIGHIGTNAIPYLLEWAAYKSPAWKDKSFAFINRTFRAGLMDRQERRAAGAMRGLAILGEEADGAFPLLVLILNDSRYTTAKPRALSLLSYFMSKHPRFARPALLNLLRDPDPNVRIAATNVLRQFDPETLKKAIAGGGKPERKSE